MALSPFSLLYHHHHHPFPELSQTDTLSLLKSHAPSLPQPWPHHLLPVSVGFDPLCACLCATSVQSCQTLCDPMDCSPPGSLVHGTLQARILEWVAMPSSRRSFQLRDQAPVSCLLHWQADSSPPCPPTSGTTQSLSAMLTHSTEHSVLQGPRLLLSEFGALWADHPGSMLFFDLSGPQ